MQDPLFSMTHKLSSVAPSKDFKIKVPENFGIAQLCKFCSPIGEKKNEPSVYPMEYPSEKSPQ